MAFKTAREELLEELKGSKVPLTMRELAKRLGFRNPSQVSVHVGQLIKEGHDIEIIEKFEVHTYPHPFLHSFRRWRVGYLLKEDGQ